MPIVGDVLAERYRIDGVLGAGGMASVYRATDLRLDREVAVKVLLPNIARDAALAQRFDGEARMLAAIAHPNVAAVFDVEPGDPASGREPFYVMELCEGGSLADQIEAGGAVDPADLVPTIEAIAEGLEELHRRGLIHRDVKPGNILFAGGRPKLADFGLARTDGSTELATLTAPGMTVGTPAYLAPEILAGGLPTVASDVYALAVTAFQGLTGVLPKPAETVSEIVAARSMPAPAVSSVAGSLGAAFDGPVAAALDQSPAARPTPSAFARELAEALARWREGASDEGASDWAAADALAETSVAIPVAIADPAPPAAPADRIRPRWSLGAVAGVLALAVAIVWLATGGLAGLVTLPPTGSAAPTSPSPTTAPAATTDVAASALRALDAVFAAIDQAQGGKDGLNGRDANDLQALAADVGGALRAGDLAAARAVAATLEDRVAELDDKLDDERGEAIRDAVDELRSAIPAG